MFILCYWLMVWRPESHSSRLTGQTPHCTFLSGQICKLNFHSVSKGSARRCGSCEAGVPWFHISGLDQTSELLVEVQQVAPWLALVKLSHAILYMDALNLDVNPEENTASCCRISFSYAASNGGLNGAFTDIWTNKRTSCSEPSQLELN